VARAAESKIFLLVPTGAGTSVGWGRSPHTGPTSVWGFSVVRGDGGLEAEPPLLGPTLG